ncbi:MAG: GntR family transcriptional regulator [Bradyrhizobiaceae bacterium]|nr:GntR family transcriptional regulator [Bradyrhizobiaceae bacterium]
MGACPLEISSPQTLRALLQLRELILSGELEVGERLSELPLVDRLGVSRTPLRAALVRLGEEGLLDPIPTGGYAVRGFDERDLYAAIEVRGALEGLAARLAAERELAPADLAALREAVRSLDVLLDRSPITVRNFDEYVKRNELFHACVIELAGSSVLARQIERAVSLPFASASAFVMVQAALPEAQDMFTIAQDHHRCVLQAIEAREGARAEALMREHARLARRNLELALRNQRTRDLVPGSGLIRFRANAAV